MPTDLGDLAGKAKDLAKEHDDKVEDAIDKVADVARDRVDGHDDKVDTAVTKAKGLIGGGGGEEPPGT